MYICRVGLYLNCSVLCNKPSQIFDVVIFTLVLYRASLDLPDTSNLGKSFMKIVPIHSMLRIIAVHQIQCGLNHSAKQVPLQL